MSGVLRRPARPRPASRTLGPLLWIAVWMANALLAILSVELLRGGRVAAPWRPVVALLPAMPLVPGLALFIALAARMDELRRRLTVTAFAVSAAIVGIAVYGWSLLVWVGAPAVPTVWVLPAELLLWGALMLALRVRYP